ncbi:MAG: DUF192 domain-containing protein [Candidatus Moranbacteria bacterium]|nr:DUF192 domain-containing protein [Candidatus Moranbacteria bacterium]
MVLKTKIKKILSNPVWVVISIVVVLMLFSVLQKQDVCNSFRSNARIEIVEKSTWKIKVVQSSEDTYGGLSKAKSLPSKNGMLFLYSRMSASPHVMRDMNFDLDFIFLRDNRIVFIKEKISKDFKGVIQSLLDCNQVLEINAGEVEKFGIEVGDEMKFINK